jgi:hypothetical protein
MLMGLSTAGRLANAPMWPGCGAATVQRAEEARATVSVLRPAGAGGQRNSLRQGPPYGRCRAALWGPRTLRSIARRSVCGREAMPMARDFAPRVTLSAPVQG